MEHTGGLCTDCGYRLVFGRGPVRGYHATSFRAKGDGLLLLLRFLIRIAKYTMVHEPWTGTVVTDSKSLLDALFGTDDTPDSKQSHPHLPDLESSQANWDVLVELRHSYNICLEFHFDTSRVIKIGRYLLHVCHFFHN
jgi:hypothetical protein